MWVSLLLVDVEFVVDDDNEDDGDDNEESAVKEMEFDFRLKLGMTKRPPSVVSCTVSSLERDSSFDFNKRQFFFSLSC